MGNTTKKKLIPVKLRQVFRHLKTRLRGMEQDYEGLSNEEIFDQIYTQGAWGKDDQGQATSGIGSHSDHIVAPYVTAVRNILERHDLTAVLDLGCGDFNVGSQLLEACETYLACDISNAVLEMNRQKFSDPKLEFRKLDVTTDPLPSAEIALIRQVLQHLSNADIKRFVERVNQTKPFKYLLVTEHLARADGFPENLDKPSGADVRVGIDSGVVLHSPPFSLDHVSRQEILTIGDVIGGAGSVIRSTLYEL